MKLCSALLHKCPTPEDSHLNPGDSASLFHPCLSLLEVYELPLILPVASIRAAARGLDPFAALVLPVLVLLSVVALKLQIARLHLHCTLVPGFLELILLCFF